MVYTIFVLLYAVLVCIAIPVIAFHVSGPAYIYQLDEGEEMELDVPVFLRFLTLTICSLHYT